jgi:hypothetical protein
MKLNRVPAPRVLLGFASAQNDQRESEGEGRSTLEMGQWGNLASRPSQPRRIRGTDAIAARLSQTSQTRVEWHCGTPSATSQA